MSKRLVSSFAVLVSLAGPVAAATAHDRDGDRLPDRWERRHALSTVARSGSGDPDRDRLTNTREHRLRTAPRRADTDRDGFDDGVEVRAGTDPRRRRSHPAPVPAAPAPTPRAPDAPGAPQLSPTPAPMEPAGPGPAPATSDCDRSATPGTLASQFSAATPGQTVCLASGEYGSFRAGAKAGPVTVKAAAGASPRMALDWSPAQNVRLEGVTVTGAKLSGATRDVTIAHSRFTGLAVVHAEQMTAANVVFDHDTFNDIDAPGTCWNCGYKGRVHVTGSSGKPNGVVVRNSTFDGGNADGVRNDGNGTQILFNTFRNLSPGDSDEHTDPIQQYGGRGTVIRGNFFEGGGGGPDGDVSAAIMIPDGGRGELIEDNVITPGHHVFAVTLYSDKDSVIRHNTFRAGACDFGLPCGTINLGNKPGDPLGSGTVIRDNVLARIDPDGNGEGGGTAAFTSDHNLLGSQNPVGAGDLRATPVFTGPTSTYAGHRLAAGSPGRGAASDGLDVGARLDGASVPAPAPEPSATPTPTPGPAPSPAPGGACDRTATPATLASQFSAATAGQTICLASGDYGTWTGGAKRVTIREQSSASATMKVDFSTGDAGFVIDGLTVAGGTMTGGARDITIRNSDFTAALRIDGLADANVLLEHNTHRNIMACTGCSAGRIHLSYSSPTPSGVTIKDSLFDGGNADGVQSGVGVNIIGNEFTDIRETGPDDPAHSDPIQLIGARGSVIRGNYIHRSADGIVAYDGLEGALIEQNVIELVNGRWGLELSSDKGSIVRHNTLVYGTGCEYAACGFIMLDRKVGDPAGTGTVIVDNVATDVSADNGSSPGERHNNLLRRSAPGVDLLGTPQFAGGATPAGYEGFRLAPGSPGKGGASDGTDIGITP